MPEPGSRQLDRICAPRSGGIKPQSVSSNIEKLVVILTSVGLMSMPRHSVVADPPTRLLDGECHDHWLFPGRRGGCEAAARASSVVRATKVQMTRCPERDTRWPGMNDDGEIFEA